MDKKKLALVMAVLMLGALVTASIFEGVSDKKTEEWKDSGDGVNFEKWVVIETENVPEIQERLDRDKDTRSALIENRNQFLQIEYDECVRTAEKMYDYELEVLNGMIKANEDKLEELK